MELRMSIELMTQKKRVTKLTKSWLRGSGRDLDYYVGVAFFS